MIFDLISRKIFKFPFFFFFQDELTSKDLFDAVYASKIIKDFKQKKLDENGQPLEPSPEESMTPEVAWTLARQTGSDIFEGGVEPSKEWKVRWSRESK